MIDWILTKDNAFSEQECDEIINTHKENGVFDNERTGYSFVDLNVNKFKYASNINYLLDEYVKQYPEAGKTTSVWSLTDMRFKHFKPGDSFSHWHSENSMTYPHRVLAMQIYLSNHNCGTEFYNDDEWTMVTDTNVDNSQSLVASPATTNSINFEGDDNTKKFQTRYVTSTTVNQAYVDVTGAMSGSALYDLAGGGVGNYNMKTAHAAKVNDVADDPVVASTFTDDGANDFLPNGTILRPG